MNIFINKFGSYRFRYDGHTDKVKCVKLAPFNILISGSE